MNQKIQRVVTAVVLVPLAIGLTYLSGWFFLCTVILLSSMAIVEMSKMARKTAKSPQVVPLLVANLAIQTMAYYRSWYLVLGTVFLFLVILYLVEIFRGNPDGSMSRIGGNLYILGIGMLFVFFMLIETCSPDPMGTKASGWRFMTTLLAGIWSFDTFSYFGGTFFGRHKMAPKISPGKSWEGFVAGLVFGVGVFVIVGWLLLRNAHPWFGWIKLTASGICIVLLGTIGDLGESLLKRDSRMKDSGNILAGHGGVLDRLDSLLVAAPGFFFILAYFFLSSGKVFL